MKLISKCLIHNKIGNKLKVGDYIKEISSSYEYVGRILRFVIVCDTIRRIQFITIHSNSPKYRNGDILYTDQGNTLYKLTKDEAMVEAL